MARLVTIPTGVQNRRGSDGSGFALGARANRDTPLTHLNYTSVVAAADQITSGQVSGAEVSFYLDNHGEGPVTIAVTGTLASDAEFVVTGRDEDGAVLTETITVATGANPSNTGSENFAGIYLTTITAPTLDPTTATWAASVTPIANTVTGGIHPYLFPVSNLDMNPDTETQESDLIGDLGAAIAPELGRFSGHLNFTTALLAEQLALLLSGWFNNPTSSTAVAIQDADGGTAINPPASANVGLTPVTTTHPSKLKIAFAAAPGSAGTFVISGYTKTGTMQRNRKYRTETITVNTTDQNYESRYYYVWDANNPLTVRSTFATQPGNARFTLDSELYEIEFEIADLDTLFNGFDVQGLVGGEPRVGNGITPNVLNINSSPTGVTFEMQCPGSQVTRRRTIQGGDIEERFIGANYLPVPKTRLGGWSGAFRYGGTLVKMTGLAIAMNRNLAPDEATDGNRFADDLEASGNRVITLSPTTRFRSSYQRTAVVENWQEFFEEERRANLEARWYHYSQEGQRRQFIVECPNAGLTENPQNTVGGAGSIDETLPFAAYATSTQTEISITLLTSESYSV